MLRKMKRTAVLAGLLALVACVPTNPSRTRTVEPLAETCDGGPVPAHISVNGRSARLFAPPGAGDGTPRPLLVSLHPFVLGATAWEDYSALASTAAARGMYVLLPEGIEPGPRWSVPGGLASETDDVAFIDALIAETARTVCIDGDRVFAAGFSAGAALAVGLSCELPGRFRAVVGSGGANLTSLCFDAAPTSAMILHGTADSVVPLTGNEVPFTPPTGLHLDSVAASFASRNDCGPRPAAELRSPTLAVTTYSCASAQLVDVRVQGMGHAWAGGNGLIDLFVGPGDASFSATNLVLDFFDNA
ncbi:MAG: hypothetical protein GX868_04395 [Actinobacteria bacterium]|nr:hypothetical protein [Actinomycetota bacterium]